jgi:ribonuclease D
MQIQQNLDFSVAEVIDYSLLPAHVSYYAENGIDIFSLKKISNAQEIAIDIETYGAIPSAGLCHWLGNIRTIQISLRDYSVHIFDLRRLPETSCDVFLAVLRGLLTSNKVVKIAHNALFECTWLMSKLGIRNISNVRCTMVMSIMLYAGVMANAGKPLSHSLKSCLLRECDQEVDKTNQTSDWGRAKLSLDQLAYAAEDALSLWSLYDKLHNKIVLAGLQKVVAVECNVLPVFASMHCDGTPLDIEKTKDVIAWHEEARAKHIDTFRQDFATSLLSGSNLNNAIRAFLKDKNYDMTQLESIWLERLKKDARASTGFDDAIITILGETFASLAALAEIRTLDKHLNYLNSMLLNERNGCTYTNYRSITATSFGRSTSGAITKATKKDSLDQACFGINHQNAAKPYDGSKANKDKSIRACFPMSIVSDLSAAHSKIAVELSQDRVSVEVENAGGDIHLFTAATLEKMNGGELTFDDMSQIKKDPSHPKYLHVKNLRDLSKNVRYSSFNLGGAARLQTTCAKLGLLFSLEECKAAIKAWREVHADIYNYQMSRLRDANNAPTATFPDSPYEYGQIRNCLGGRLYLRKSPGFYSDKLEVKASDCMSFLWMSIEAYVMKKSMILIHNKFQANTGWQARISIFCHDELDVVCKEEYKETVAEVVFGTMNTVFAEIVKSIPVTQDTYKDCLVTSWLDK